VKRPYISLVVRIIVAERQVREKHPLWTYRRRNRDIPLRDRLKDALHILFDDQKVELHHRPALCNRLQFGDINRRYDPPANDPDHLVYLPKHDHDIETRVRGIGAQLGDLGKLRKEKKRTRKAAAMEFVKGSLTYSTKPTKPKRKWPSRPFVKKEKRKWLSQRGRQESGDHGKWKR
jgi:hypothetical protein